MHILKNKSTQVCQHIILYDIYVGNSSNNGSKAAIGEL